MILTAHYYLPVKAVRSSCEVCRVKLYWVVDFIPHKSYRVDYVSRGMSFREHIAYLLERVDIPLRNTVLEHSVLHLFRDNKTFFVLSHELHYLERKALFHAVFVDKRHHNVVTAPDNVGNRAYLIVDKLFRVSEPAACSVSKSGYLEQVREILRLSFHKNAADELCTHLRQSERRGFGVNLLGRYSYRFG